MNRPLLLRTVVLTISVCAFLAPVGDDTSEAQAGRRRRQHFLKVRKFKPRHRKKFVDPEGELRVRFSKPVDEATVTRLTVSVRELSGFEVPWTFRLDRNGKELVVIPELRLDPGTDYEMRVNPGLLATTGDARTLKKSKRAQFFTDPFVSPTQLLRPDQFVDVQGAMSEGRAGHSATLLGDGRILLAGGVNDLGLVTDTADLFFPGSDRFVPTLARMRNARSYQPAVRLGGDALVIGGWNGTVALAETEIFNANSSAFFPAPSMNEARDFHAAVAIAGGRVLVVGGLSYTNRGAVFSITAEIFDPAENAWRFTLGPPVTRRGGHTLTLLPDGRVLVMGGEPSGAASAEIFDPVTETFRRTINAPLQPRQLHNATLLDDFGTVLLSDGGSAALELFDPAEERFFPAGGASFVNRTRSTASLLPGGRVLLAGGFDSTPAGGTLILSGMDLYVPDQGDFGRVLRASVVFGEPRAVHTATTLPDDRVVFVGGFDPAGVGGIATGVIFTPDPVDEE